MNLRATRREPTKLASLEAMASDQATNLEDTQPRSSVALDWTSDAENPRNWSLARRAVSTAVVSGIGFVRCVITPLWFYVPTSSRGLVVAVPPPDFHERCSALLGQTVSLSIFL